MPFPQRIRSHFLHHWSKSSPPQYIPTSRSGDPCRDPTGDTLNLIHRWRARSEGFPLLIFKVWISFLCFWLIEIDHFQDSRSLYIPAIFSIQFSHSSLLSDKKQWFSDRRLHDKQNMMLRIINSNLSNQKKSKSKSQISFWRITLHSWDNIEIYWSERICARYYDDIHACIKPWIGWHIPRLQCV